ncbi:SusC/RagA family TonB-linked outer membrane protein [Adhaeribacter arboris]|uniref:SusC/RagA family TonB-linked outer membrane protein n=1 Tax=Adhaeribacter arboris TaxID=2072846 RepID=A0A2T2YNG9_9BACT|nr:TonB-dependent receptor [Adhaeribacter arboris]PSR57029.1 SusC/RagA family TonB-linked outer membrane protein [Adhaeribacter arboris]
MRIFTNQSHSGLQWLLVMFLIFGAGTQVLAQNEAVITGTVVDEKGDALPGVTLLVKGSTQGVVSDGDGKYTVNVPGNKGVLVVSYVGFLTQEVAVNGSATIRITLTGDAKALNEVVVIGYGLQKRETVTGSIATVKAEDFNAGLIADPLTLISGKVAGLTVTRPNGSDPNAGAQFSLRGATTVYGYNGPLIVIDGVPGGDLQTIAPSDIASVDVLKDGSAAAIYGSRATGGVIIITTKKGKAGAPTVTYSGNVSFDQVAKKYDMLTGEQYRKLGTDNGLTVDDRGANTDWFKEVTRTPVSQVHNVSVSGGNEKTNYYASVNYRDFKGMDKVTDRESVNGTVRLNTKALNDKLDFALNLTNTFDNRTFANYGAIAQSLNMLPVYPVRNTDGTYFENPDTPYQLQWNPVANMANNTNGAKESRLLGTVSAAYRILPALKASVNYSIIKNSYLNSSFSSNQDFFQQQNSLNGQASRSQTTNTNNIFEGLLTYNKQFGQHNLDVLGGYSYQNIFEEGLGAGNNNFITNSFLYYNLGAGRALNELTPGFNRSGVFVNSYAWERTLLAGFARVLYNFDEKYLLNLSIRREGASVLGVENKWGNFPSVSAGWVLSKENFLADNGIITNLKLRGGYGVTGNQESLGPYQSLSTLGAFAGQSGYFDGQWLIPYGSTYNANPLLRWETKNEVNVGLDFALFKNGWLNGSLDFYNRRINNLIGNYTAQLPSQINPNIFANAGTMENQGFELALNAQVANRDKFSWNVSFTGAYNKNKIKSVTSDQFKGTAFNITDVGVGFTQRIAAGQPIGVFYGRKFAGFNDDGKWLFYNQAGDAVTAEDAGDSYFYLGSGIPKYNLGLTNNFRFGAFDATILFRGAFGFKALNAKRIFHENYSNFTTHNLFQSAINKGVKNDQMYFSDYYLEKGDYLKLDNLTIGYSLPVKANGFIKSLRFYATGTNLLTLTKYSGTDPELPLNVDLSGEQEFTTGPGVEANYSYYPFTRTYTFGITGSF